MKVVKIFHSGTDRRRLCIYNLDYIKRMQAVLDKEKDCICTINLMLTAFASLTFHFT